jgi:hypothetical protein
MEQKNKKRIFMKTFWLAAFTGAAAINFLCTKQQSKFKNEYNKNIWKN